MLVVNLVPSPIVEQRAKALNTVNKKCLPSQTSLENSSLEVLHTTQRKQKKEG